MIPLKDVYLLPQHREEEPCELDLTDLVPSITSQGLFTPPRAAVFDQKGFAEYIELTNALHKSSLVVENFPPNYGEYWLVLIFGHRRIMACREIHRNFPEGCVDECPTPDGREFLARLKKGVIELDLIANPRARVAKIMQLDENLNREVDPHKRAVVAAEMFHLAKVFDPDLSVAQFVRETKGLSEDQLQDALKFDLLPKIAKDAVKRGIIQFGHAVQIGRFVTETKSHDPNDTAIGLLGKVINDQPSVVEFTAWISQKVRQFKGSVNQLDMIEIMGVTLSTKEKVRHRTEEAAGRSLERIILHFKGMAFLFEQRVLDLKDSPLLKPSNAKKTRVAIEQMSRTLESFSRAVELLRDLGIPHISKLVKMLEKIEAEKAKEMIDGCIPLVQELENLTELSKK